MFRSLSSGGWRGKRARPRASSRGFRTGQNAARPTSGGESSSTMSSGPGNPWYHEDLRRFRDALTLTEAESGFSARLIEKDYYCSLLLLDLSGPFEQGLVFKGGTCLSKVHADFFRLSEDLDL